MNYLDVMSDEKFLAFMFLYYGYTEFDVQHLTSSSLHAFYSDYLSSLV